MKRLKWLTLLCISAPIIFVSGCAAKHTNVTDVAPDALVSGKSIAVVYALDCAERTLWNERCTKDSGLKDGGEFRAYPRTVSPAASSIGNHDELRIAATNLEIRKILQASVAEHFNPRFESNGLKLIAETENVRSWTLPQKGKPRVLNLSGYYRDGTEQDIDRQSSVVSFNRDYQSVIERLNTDYLLVIQILQYGVVRQYTPIVSVAVEPPTAIAAIRATVHAKNAAKPVYDNIITRSDVPDFEWKVPPDFQALMELPPLTLNAVVKDAATELF